MIYTLQYQVEYLHLGLFVSEAKNSSGRLFKFTCNKQSKKNYYKTPEN